MRRTTRAGSGRTHRRSESSKTAKLYEKKRNSDERSHRAEGELRRRSKHAPEEVREHDERGADDATRDDQRTMLPCPESARDMRNDESDEPDQAGRGDGRRRDERRQDEDV